MALITCAECGHNISDKAEACPSCGAKQKRRGAARTGLAVFAAIGFGLAATVVAGTVATMSGTHDTSIPMLLAFAVGAVAGWFRVMR